MGYKTKDNKCSQEMVDKAIEYVDGGYKEQEQVVPTSEGLALYLGVARQTPINWANQEHNEFREDFQYINDRLMATQAVKIVNGGLTKEFDSGFCGKLAGNHGYIDKQSVEHSGPGGKAIQTESKVEWVIQPVKPVDEADS